MQELLEIMLRLQYSTLAVIRTTAYDNLIGLDPASGSVSKDSFVPADPIYFMQTL